MACVSLKEAKQYIRVDYTDDDELIELMIDAVTDEMQELIPKFDPGESDIQTEAADLFVCEGTVRQT